MRTALPYCARSACAVIGWFATLNPASAGTLAHAQARLVAPSEMCVTEGHLGAAPDHQMRVDDAKMRAYVNGPAADAVELRFVYQGGTAAQSALGSGAVRRQLGLKLRAGDGCNLIYLMWRIEPQSKLVGSVKLNAGQHSSAQCANHGYQNIKPDFSAPIPALRPGDAHRLRAEIRERRLRGYIDGALVWDGALGPGVALSGPPGVRTDNARLLFSIAVDEAAADASAKPAPDQRMNCESGSTAEE
jgi:hypothetical protein